MAQFYPALSDAHRAFIERQSLFFVATAAASGRVNLSPKGLDSFRVLGPKRVAWLNLTGSGNETAAHVLKDPRMTLMFLSFEKQPLIMRLYGTARMIQHADTGWNEMIERFGSPAGARQIFDVQVEQVQDSCGFAVPLMQFGGERDTLVKWAENKGPSGIAEYQQERNGVSIDGFETGI